MQLTILNMKFSLGNESRGSIMKIIHRSLWLIMVLMFTSVTLGQDKSSSEIIETAVAKLQQKVLLSDQQASDVMSLLTRNADSLKNGATRDKAVKDANSKIEQMLDARQKAKYSIIKDDWLSNLSKELSQT
jgi:hypothetical protein